MKKFLLIFLLSLPAHGLITDSIELLSPGLTYHVTDGGASHLYSNQISQDGRLIYTPLIGLKKTRMYDEIYHSLSLFHANNSIGSPIWGGTGATGVQIFDFINLGLVYGGYIQNNEDYRAKGIVPFSMTGNTNAFVPLFGVEANMHWELSQKVFLGFNNTLTPIITNHNLSLGLNY